MFKVDISDPRIISEAFSDRIVSESLEADPLIEAGIMRDPRLGGLEFGQMGVKFKIRHPNPLRWSEPGIHSDDPNDFAEPSAWGGENIAVMQSFNKTWPLPETIAGCRDGDWLDNMASLAGKYWLSVRNSRIMASMAGLVADSVANHGSDLVMDLADGDLPDALTTAWDKTCEWGMMCQCDRYARVMVVHSDVYTDMRKLDLINNESPDGSDNFVPNFLGIRVLIDDGAPVELITPKGRTKPEKVYTSYMFGGDAIFLGYRAPRRPVEAWRDPMANDCRGADMLISRTDWIIHPLGYKCNLGDTPTLDQLAAADSWTRVCGREGIPIQAIKTRGLNKAHGRTREDGGKSGAGDGGVSP